MSLPGNILGLGSLIDITLTYKVHINTIVHKAFVRLRLLLKCFRTRDKNILTRSYCTYVRPTLEYCSPIPIWSPHIKQLVNRKSNAQKYLTGAISGFSLTVADYNYEGLKTPEHRRPVNDLSLCYKIVHGLVQCTIPGFPSFLASRTRGHPLGYAKGDVPPNTGTSSSLTESLNPGTLYPSYWTSLTPQHHLLSNPAFHSLTSINTLILIK